MFRVAIIAALASAVALSGCSQKQDLTPEQRDRLNSLAELEANAEARERQAAEELAIYEAKNKDASEAVANLIKERATAQAAAQVASNKLASLEAVFNGIQEEKAKNEAEHAQRQADLDSRKADQDGSHEARMAELDEQRAIIEAREEAAKTKFEIAKAQLDRAQEAEKAALATEERIQEAAKLGRVSYVAGDNLKPLFETTMNGSQVDHPVLLMITGEMDSEELRKVRSEVSNFSRNEKFAVKGLKTRNKANFLFTTNEINGIKKLLHRLNNQDGITAEAFQADALKIKSTLSIKYKDTPGTLYGSTSHPTKTFLISEENVAYGTENVGTDLKDVFTYTSFPEICKEVSYECVSSLLDGSALQEKKGDKTNLELLSAEIAKQATDYKAGTDAVSNVTIDHLAFVEVIKFDIDGNSTTSYVPVNVKVSGQEFNQDKLNEFGMIAKGMFFTQLSKDIDEKAEAAPAPTPAATPAI